MSATLGRSVFVRSGFRRRHDLVQQRRRTGQPVRGVPAGLQLRLCRPATTRRRSPGISRSRGSIPHHLGVDELLERIRPAAPFIRGITASGGEATQQPAFLHALFAAVKADPGLAHLTCFVDSNGATDPQVWDDLAPVIDGAMIDLKCLDPAIHLEMTGQPNAPGARQHRTTPPTGPAVRGAPADPGGCQRRSRPGRAAPVNGWRRSIPGCGSS